MMRQPPCSVCPAPRALSAHFPALLTGDFADSRAFTLRERSVIHVFDASCQRRWRAWPGRHAYVRCWVVLDNGLAVGCNNNPLRGLSFPVLRAPADLMRPTPGQ